MGERRIALDGALAGFLGAVVVAVWFLVVDVSRGQPFATPALLAAVLLHGAPGPIASFSTMRLVLEYSAFHFANFVIFGWFVAWLLEVAERQPTFLWGILVLLFWFEVFFLSFLGIVSDFALKALIWWRILGANVLAIAVMMAFFAFRHPVMVAQVRKQWKRGREALTPLGFPRTRHG
jgi:hypothetical protein